MNTGLRSIKQDGCTVSSLEILLHQRQRRAAAQLSRVQRQRQQIGESEVRARTSYLREVRDGRQIPRGQEPRHQFHPFALTGVPHVNRLDEQSQQFRGYVGLVGRGHDDQGEFSRRVVQGSDLLREGGYDPLVFLTLGGSAEHLRATGAEFQSAG